MEPGDDISMIKGIQLISKLEDGQSILAVTYQGNVITLDNSWDHNQIKSYLTPNGGDNDSSDDLLELDLELDIEPGGFEEIDDLEIRMAG